MQVKEQTHDQRRRKMLEVGGAGCIGIEVCSEKIFFAFICSYQDGLSLHLSALY